MFERQYHLTVLTVSALLIISTVARAQTQEEARAFFEDFDRTTSAEAVRDDVVAAINAAERGIKNEKNRAEGIPPSQEDLEAAEDAKTELADDGVYERLSDLQLEKIEEHFQTPTGSIDFNKFQRAVEMFANGELRPSPESDLRDMAYTGAWLRWKQFAEGAIDNTIFPEEWREILKSLQKGLEIYQASHPSGGPTTENPEGWSMASDFDPDKQLTEAQKAALRAEIDGLTTEQVLNREAEFLDSQYDDFQFMDPPRRRFEWFANVTASPGQDGFDVAINLTLAEESGEPVLDTAIGVLLTDARITLIPDGFAETTAATAQGEGRYLATFFVPGEGRELIASVLDSESRSRTSFSLFVPEPSTVSLLALGCISVVTVPRRRGGRFLSVGLLSRV